MRMYWVVSPMHSNIMANKIIQKQDFKTNLQVKMCQMAIRAEQFIIGLVQDKQNLSCTMQHKWSSCWGSNAQRASASEVVSWWEAMSDGKNIILLFLKLFWRKIICPSSNSWSYSYFELWPCRETNHSCETYWELVMLSWRAFSKCIIGFAKLDQLSFFVLAL